MTEYEKYQVKRAKHLLDSLGMSTGNNVTKDIESDLIKICAGRPIYKCVNEISKFALELCQNIDDIEALEISLRACKNLPVAFRPQAIEIAKQIIDKDPNPWSYYQYGLLLLADVQLKEAEEAFKIAYKLEPSSDLICVHLAKTYVKLNMIDKGLDLLYNFKASTYYGQKYKDYFGNERVDKSSIAYIDYMISDLENKKSKGYIYRPRKKHQNKIKSDTNQIKDKVNETILKIDKKKKSDIDTSYISNIVNEELERLKRNGIIEETDID